MAKKETFYWTMGNRIVRRAPSGRLFMLCSNWVVKETWTAVWEPFPDDIPMNAVEEFSSLLGLMEFLVHQDVNEPRQWGVWLCRYL